jgi:hypothetical protein
MDYFRIYRKVHDDFDSLGPPPFALTQMQEWSEDDQQRADEWEGRRRAKEAELSAGRYGEIQNEIRQLQEEKRIEDASAEERAKRDARIGRLQKEANELRDNALRSAHLLGRNPYPGKGAARLKDFQQRLEYHASADWEDRTPEEVAGTAPPKMKEWLLRVRGY